MEMGASFEPASTAEERGTTQAPPPEISAAEMQSVEAPASESSEDAAPEAATETDTPQS
jgi:hypothetical protein